MKLKSLSWPAAASAAARPRLEVGADEGDQALVDLDLPVADVARDHRRHHARLELLAEGALEVDVLDQRDGRLRGAEHVAVLRDPLERLLHVLGAGQGVRERALRGDFASDDELFPVRTNASTMPSTTRTARAAAPISTFGDARRAPPLTGGAATFA